MIQDPEGICIAEWSKIPSSQAFSLKVTINLEGAVKGELY